MHAKAITYEAENLKIEAEEIININLKLGSYYVFEEHDYQLAILILKRAYSLVEANKKFSRFAPLILSYLSYSLFFNDNYLEAKSYFDKFTAIEFDNISSYEKAFYKLIEAHFACRFKNYGKAYESYSFAYKEFKELFKSKLHPEILLSLLGKAASSSLLVPRNLKKAKNYYKSCIKIGKSLYQTEDHPRIAYILHGYGTLLIDLKLYKDAEERINQALNIRNKIYQTKYHPEVGSAYRMLGKIYFLQDNMKRALNYFNKSMKIKLNLLKTDIHFQLSELYEYLARSHVKMDQFMQAKKYSLMWVKCLKEVYNDQEERVINAINFLK